MKRNRKPTHFFLLLAATVLTFGLSQNTALAKKDPLTVILERLDAFVLELEAIDVQVEELENPSFEDKILDATGIELCGYWTILGIGGETTLFRIAVEGEAGLGLGPNFMGTGLAAKLEPTWNGDGNLTSRIQAGSSAEFCLNVYDLAEIIIEQSTTAEAGKYPELDALDASPDPLEAFVHSLNQDAKDQILAFADQSPVDLLELVVLLLQKAGIDPTDPDTDSLADNLLAPVEAITTYATDLSPENFLDLDRASAILASIPFEAGLQDSFTDSLAAITSFGFDDIDPCTAEFLPGLVDFRNAVCGVGADYLEQLDKLAGELSNGADEVEGLALSVKTEAIEVRNDFNDAFVDLKNMFGDIKSKVCKNFGDRWEKKVSRVFSCSASVSFNPCNVASINISASCSWRRINLLASG